MCRKSHEQRNGFEYLFFRFLVYAFEGENSVCSHHFRKNRLYDFTTQFADVTCFNFFFCSLPFAHAFNFICFCSS